MKQRNHGERDQYYVENTHPAIIPREMFEKVQELLRRKGQRVDMQRESSPLARKITCGICGATLIRRIGKSGYTVWVCRRHDRKASDCTNGRISEQLIHEAFLRMYHKLRVHEGIILRPVLRQLDDLTEALHRGDPAMLAVNEAIAVMAEKNHNLSKLHTAGLLDADALVARQTEINAKITELRQQRRNLLNNQDLDEQIDAIRQTVDIIQNGPEQLDGFDEILFTTLVEKITADSTTGIHFLLHGGLEFQETLEVR